MKVEACMSTDIRIASPAQPIRDAARTMKEIDAGFLPVGENDRLVGIVTDRDIIVRALAEGKGPDTPVRDVMTEEVLYCFEDDDFGAVTSRMGELKARSQCQQAANRGYSHSGTSCRPAMTTKLGCKTR
jgi:CBS domain-containing protein